MLKWLLGKSSRTSDAARAVDQLLLRVPSDIRGKLSSIRSRLPSLAITSADAAKKELESRNVSRAQVWGDQAANIPIYSGSADDVMALVLSCLVSDYERGGVTNVTIEEVAQVGVQAETASRLAQLSPGARAKFEKKLAKHAQKERGTVNSTSPARKIVITAHFAQTFGRHEILHVNADLYYAMPCTQRPAEAD